MGAIARRLTFLRQRLWSKRDILTSLIEKDWQFFLTGVKVPYLRDIYDHLVSPKATHKHKHPSTRASAFEPFAAGWEQVRNRDLDR